MPAEVHERHLKLPRAWGIKTNENVLWRSFQPRQSSGMNRTDRLFAMLLLLQSRRVITAAQIASHFEVTERTVYRDLAALVSHQAGLLKSVGDQADGRPAHREHLGEEIVR